MPPAAAAWAPERVTLLGSLLFGLAFIIAVPPFQAPDEPGHFLRAYQISEGGWLADLRSGTAGGELPTSLERFAGIFVSIPFHPERKATPRMIAEAAAMDLRPAERSFLLFPGAALYTPVPYLPQAAAILPGRLSGAGPLVLFGLARLGNLLAATVLAVLAVRMAPFAKWVFALLALNPMTLFLRASASGDSLTGAAAFLLVALVLRFAAGTEPVRRADIAAFFGSIAVVCLCKPAYFLLPLLVLAVPAPRLGSAGRALLLKAGALATGAAAAAASLATTRSRYTPLQTDAWIDPAQQAHGILAAPFRHAVLMAADYAQHHARLVAQLVGNFGWLDAPLPPLAVVLWAALLVLVAIFGGSKVRAIPVPLRIAMIAVLAGTAVILSTSQYLVWTNVGAPFIEGVMGRYFIPVAPLALLPLATRSMAIDLDRPSRAMVLSAAPFVLLAVSIVTVVERYWRGA